VLTFERRVETYASDSDRKIPQKSHQKDTLVAITDTARDPLIGKKHKDQIRQRVDDLSRIDGGIVVLGTKLVRAVNLIEWRITCLFAPIYC
jgi:hypothetical protein